MRSIKFLYRVVKNIDYVENPRLKFYLVLAKPSWNFTSVYRVEIFTCNYSVVVKRSWLFSRDGTSTWVENLHTISTLSLSQIPWLDFYCLKYKFRTIKCWSAFYLHIYVLGLHKFKCLVFPTLLSSVSHSIDICTAAIQNITKHAHSFYNTDCWHFASER